MNFPLYFRKIILAQLIVQAQTIYKHTDPTELLDENQIWFLKATDDKQLTKSLYSANIKPGSKIIEINQEPEETLISQALKQKPDVILFSTPNSKQFFVVNPDVLINVEEAQDSNQSNDIPFNGVSINGKYDNYSGLAQFVYPGTSSFVPGGAAGFTQLPFFLPGNI